MTKKTNETNIKEHNTFPVKDGLKRITNKQTNEQTKSCFFSFCICISFRKNTLRQQLARRHGWTAGVHMECIFYSRYHELHKGEKMNVINTNEREKKEKKMQTKTSIYTFASQTITNKRTGATHEINIIVIYWQTQSEIYWYPHQQTNNTQVLQANRSKTSSQNGRNRALSALSYLLPFNSRPSVAPTDTKINAENVIKEIIIKKKQWWW